ncbi:hypothetical protein PtrV1_02447 [Pyrenophora tritici-repentis]|uniref:Uncharacterized protein n=1 Tax=Pyrenophora tritici-repentis TaxID=45151 RepID=A0A5M9LMM9_9PLEO|nr:hypothetical protein PtrV1_02447 [Pyrenophora tritici-repentis]KAF7578367.1 hypothetical protein PtrM4_026070 [Pyrenophora tritici-repentis]
MSMLATAGSSAVTTSATGTLAGPDITTGCSELEASSSRPDVSGRGTVAASSATRSRSVDRFATGGRSKVGSLVDAGAGVDSVTAAEADDGSFTTAGTCCSDKDDFFSSTGVSVTGVAADSSEIEARLAFLAFFLLFLEGDSSTSCFCSDSRETSSGCTTTASSWNSGTGATSAGPSVVVSSAWDSMGGTTS